MKISVDIDKRTNGAIQICVIRSIHSGGFVKDYPTVKDARDVLIALGLPITDIDSKLKLLEELGSKERLHFQAQEISDDVLKAQGFRV